MKQTWTLIKPYLRWVIIVGVLFFLSKALKDHADEVAAIEITKGGWIYLAIALPITLLAHAWAGWVWSWILQEFKQPVHSPWIVQVYLKNNIAKYLPGSIWHYYGRISTVRTKGVPATTATLSVLIEPMLMVAAALIIVLLGGISQNPQHWKWQVLGLSAVLISFHPKILNPLLRLISKIKGKLKKSSVEANFQIQRYPLLPLLGEIGFISLRAIGFLLIFLALTPVTLSQFPMLFSTFSLAWLSTTVVPAAPGGIGVFEATAIALLDQPFSTGVVLSVAALYRLISILAEAAGAGLAFWGERRVKQSTVK